MFHFMFISSLKNWYRVCAWAQEESFHHQKLAEKTTPSRAHWCLSQFKMLRNHNSIIRNFFFLTFFALIIHQLPWARSDRCFSRTIFQANSDAEPVSITRAQFRGFGERPVVSMYTRRRVSPRSFVTRRWWRSSVIMRSPVCLEAKADINDRHSFALRLIL